MPQHHTNEAGRSKAAPIPRTAHSSEEQARPGQARPGQARPGQARPGQARPGQARPGQARHHPRGAGTQQRRTHEVQVRGEGGEGGAEKGGERAEEGGRGRGGHSNAGQMLFR